MYVYTMTKNLKFKNLNSSFKKKSNQKTITLRVCSCQKYDDLQILGNQLK